MKATQLIYTESNKGCTVNVFVDKVSKYYTQQGVENPDLKMLDENWACQQLDSLLYKKKKGVHNYYFTSISAGSAERKIAADNRWIDSEISKGNGVTTRYSALLLMNRKGLLS